jgi:predicted nuclease with TOPRIM domain
MIKNVFEHDAEYQEVEEEKTEVYQQWKQRKNTLNETTQVRELKDELRELKDEQKDIEESLSNHLINYHQLTNSTSFDTSDGDQWEFQIKAKVKSRKVE